jgi:hypothetical protein
MILGAKLPLDQTSCAVPEGTAISTFVPVMVSVASETGFTNVQTGFREGVLKSSDTIAETVPAESKKTPTTR